MSHLVRELPARVEDGPALIVAYLTFFCVHSRSRCTSLAAFIPSAKFALVFARRARACACSASSSRFFALSSPDLRWKSVLKACCSLSRFARSHLRLLDQILIQWDGVVSLRQAIVHVVEEVDARRACRGAVIFAAGIVARRRRIQTCS